MIVTYRLESGAAVLRIDVDVDWREPQSLLKLHFPTAYRGSFARYGAPFGSVLRSQQPGPVSTEAQWEVPGSRWAAVALDGEREGLALITEAKYGFSCRDGELTVSLLRGARITGCDDHRYAAPPGLNRHRPESPFSDGGKHRIRLAVGSYDACGPMEQHPAALADTLFTAPVVYRGDPVNAGLVAVEGAPTLIPHWAMPVGKQRWVLRLHEVSGQRGVARMKLGSGWKAHRCGLDGLVEKGAGEVEEIGYGPYQIVSVMLVRK
jgi:alpha-mannosidase